MSGVLDPAQHEGRARRADGRMLENLRIQKLIVGVHVLNDYVQYVITLAGHRVALGDLWQSLYMPLEVVPVFVGVLCHGDCQQNLYLKTRLAWIKNSHLPLDQACLLEVTYTSPARCSRHSGQVRQFDLATSCIDLQGVEQAAIRGRQFHDLIFPINNVI